MNFINYLLNAQQYVQKGRINLAKEIVKKLVKEHGYSDELFNSFKENFYEQLTANEKAYFYSIYADLRAEFKPNEFTDSNASEGNVEQESIYRRGRNIYLQGNSELENEDEIYDEENTKNEGEWFLNSYKKVKARLREKRIKSSEQLALIKKKAAQKSSDLIDEYDLGNDYYKPIFNILLAKGNNYNTIAQLRCLIIDNVTARELVLAFKLRARWEADGFSYRDGKRYQYSSPCAQISWVNSVTLLRVLRTDDIDDAMIFINDLYDLWRDKPGIIEISPSFYVFLCHSIDSLKSSSDLKGELLPVLDEIVSFDSEFNDVDFNIERVVELNS